MPPQPTNTIGPDAAASYYAVQSAAALSAAVAAIGIWRGIDGKNLDTSFAGLLPRLLAAVGGRQAAAAQAGNSYLAHMLALQGETTSGTTVAAAAFAGLTGDGRSMAGLLYTPVAFSKQYIGQGLPIADVITQEEAHLAMLVRTQVQDSGRMALQAGMAAESKIRGYIRKVNLPACARCIILAGRFYRYSAGFLRHPNCDCTMIPAVGEEYVTPQDPADLIARMQAEHAPTLKKSLSDSDLQALARGANLNQVVNAHRPRGMSTAAGTAHSTWSSVRRSPAQIFEEASTGSLDRNEVVRQLATAGYIT